MALRIAVLLLLALLLFSPWPASAAEIRVPAGQNADSPSVDSGDPRYNSTADFDRNGVVDGDDLVIFSFYFGATV